MEGRDASASQTQRPAARRVLKRRLAHALPELVFFRDDLENAVRGSRAVRRSVRLLAEVQRRRLDGVLFVAVTGSSAKTTTKELIAAVLGSRLTGTKTAASANTLMGVARTLLRTSPENDFGVFELGTDTPGMLQQLVDLVRPRIGVVTTVGLDHLSNLGSPDAIAAEKRSLVQALPAEGVAVLNGDDPRVLAMGEACAGRVVTFGLHPEAALSADHVRATWPEPLSFTLRYDGTAVPVRTSLYGRHWAHSVLAALAVGIEAGVPLVDAVRAVETVEPVSGRMQPIYADGVTFIRDDVKAGLLTALPALDFMEEARAARKIVVFGRIGHFAGDPHDAYAALATRALAVADEVIFAGPEARYAPAPTNGRGRLHLVPSVKQAAQHLLETSRPGDLVLLKGSHKVHLGRVILARTTRVACWLPACGRRRSCEQCELVDHPSEPTSPLPGRLITPRPRLLPPLH